MCPALIVVSIALPSRLLQVARNIALFRALYYYNIKDPRLGDKAERQGKSFFHRSLSPQFYIKARTPLFSEEVRRRIMGVIDKFLMKGGLR